MRRSLLSATIPILHLHGDHVILPPQLLLVPGERVDTSDLVPFRAPTRCFVSGRRLDRRRVRGLGDFDATFLSVASRVDDVPLLAPVPVSFLDVVPMRDLHVLPSLPLLLLYMCLLRLLSLLLLLLITMLVLLRVLLLLMSMLLHRLLHITRDGIPFRRFRLDLGDTLGDTSRGGDRSDVSLRRDHTLRTVRGLFRVLYLRRILVGTVLLPFDFDLLLHQRLLHRVGS